MRPRVIVHSLDHARAALRAARALKTPLTLESAVGAAGNWGTGAWVALIRRVREEFSDIAFDTVLDCADDWGYALSALRAGAEAIRVTGPPDVIAKIAAIAAAKGAKVANETGDSLDLAPFIGDDPAEVERKVHTWLGRR